MGTPAGRHEFRFGLGHVTLEFLATLGGRFGEPVERLRKPADLGRWLAEEGLVASARCDEHLLLEARDLREAIYRTLEAVRRGVDPRQSDVDVINGWARRAVPAPQIGANLTRTWTASDATGGLAQLARLSVNLLTGRDVRRVQDCAREGCSLLFIDHSRPGRRRWCSMERCGNRAKTRRYRQRRSISRVPRGDQTARQAR